MRNGMAGKREAVTALPRAWAELMREPEELLIDIVGGKAEGPLRVQAGDDRCAGVPAQLRSSHTLPAPERKIRWAAPAEPLPALEIMAPVIAREVMPIAQPEEDQSVRFTLFGKPYQCATAAQALVEILNKLASGDPGRVLELAHAVRGRSRSMIARTVAEINPARPDLARAAEFAPGWFVGLNLSNRDKMAVIRTACAVFAIRISRGSRSRPA
jgi:hypothetical protein